MLKHTVEITPILVGLGLLLWSPWLALIYFILLFISSGVLLSIFTRDPDYYLEEVQYDQQGRVHVYVPKPMLRGRA